MLTIDQLKTVITDSREIYNQKKIRRDFYLGWLIKSSSNRLIKAVTGVRRAGKTFLLKQFSSYLIKEKKIPFWNVCFLNFEHDLLSGIRDVYQLRLILEVYLKNLTDPKGQIYLIFDEIQNVDGWEKLIRILYEKERFNIYISGSNSRLLAGEFASSLSGRLLQLEVFPFSFREYLQYQKIEVGSEEDYYQQKQVIDSFYQKYLLYGGLPEQFELSEDLRKNYLKNLLQKIIFDDIVRRYEIRKSGFLPDIFKFIVGNVTSVVSLRKIANRLTAEGIKISVSTLETYLKYFQNAYIFFKLPRFSYKLSNIFDKTNKYYAIDNLFLNFDFISREKKLENLVACFLIRKFGVENVFFGKEDKGYEVDFVVRKPQGNFLLIQVCLYLNDQNQKREIGNLLLANRYLKGEPLLVVEEDFRKITDSEVKVKKITEFLLGF